MDNRVKEEIKKDVLNGLDIKESITTRIARLLRDNNIHGKTFYIPLETETDNYNRFNIVSNELRHNDINVLIDTSRLTYKDYCDIEDILNLFIKINKLEESIKNTREQIIDKLLQDNNITDKKEIFKFRVNLRKQQSTKYLYNYYNRDVFTSYNEIQDRNYNLNVYLDYLKHKLSKLS